MLDTSQLVKDVGTMLEGKEAVKEGLIDEVGGIKEALAKLYEMIEKSVESEKMLRFTYHYPARCFGMNMPKSRDIQAKIPLPQAIWNEFWLRY